MGLGGVSIWQLLILLLVVVMVFGTSRLKSLGSDLGEAIKGFRNSLHSEESKSEPDGHKQTVVDSVKSDDPLKKG